MTCRDRLEGSIPSCDNSSVIAIRRNDLNLTGILPSWVGTGCWLPALQLLELSDNVDLSGTVPGVWGSALPKLEVLNLHSSGLTGTFPGKTTYGTHTYIHTTHTTRLLRTLVHLVEAFAELALS